MPREIHANEKAEGIDRWIESDDDNRFSQEDDDKAGRSWHGLNSEVASDEVGRFKEDEDDDEVEEPPRPVGTERT